MKLGAQLFTLREFCKDLDGFALSLKKVADIGYTTVQISGTCEFEAEWLKAELQKNGLTCVVTHVPVAKLQENLDQVCADHKVFGCENVGLGFYSFKKCELPQGYEEFRDAWLPVAKGVKERGLRFMYHNHSSEFRKVDGKPILLKMAEDFSPQEMGFILDTFWLQAGGVNPAEYIRKFAGRCPCVHLKDFMYAPGEVKEGICAVGDGNINFDAVVSAAEDAGVQYLLVEQDDCHGEDPFECMRRSYEYLKAMGLN